MAARWWAVYDNDKARRDELEQQLKDSRMQLQREMDQFNRQDFMQEQTMHLRARECLTPSLLLSLPSSLTLYISLWLLPLLC